MASERPVILDTGPLVAFVIQREPAHAWAEHQFKLLPAPFITCEAVLTESFHLPSRVNDGPRRFFELMSRHLLVVDFTLSAHTESLQRIIQRYQDLPMSLADACLVRMLTLDHHFKIYRKHGRQPISLVTPQM